ncbi:hypothetical protein [Flavobacterium sp. M31R6]|uniref:hypothetical protein n=1 Tax=Flavobacterium sp. M31R6 TaxID=2739062 RepID=UPI0015684E6A|nr:hypothetical protein [Flavobacterium sp. M31R6]QKJ64960.1 hypothetical protein HQN62_18090 [Flavobacterium sp. M31R6]
MKLSFSGIYRGKPIKVRTANTILFLHGHIKADFGQPIITHNIPKYPQNKKKGIKPFQLKPSVIMFSKENGKLCFEMLEMNSASQNNLPCRGLKNVSKVAVLLKLQMETG